MLELSGVRLRIVPAECVLSHEIPDPRRERRIEERLQEDGVLRDPVTVGVVPSLHGYVLLDGTNRQHALRSLGMPHILVQLLDYADHHAIQLRTWAHGADHPVQDIAEAARGIPGVLVEPLPPLEASHALQDSTTLAILLDVTHRYRLARSAPQDDRVAQLRALVDVYEDGLSRLDCAPDELEERAKALSASGKPAALIAFPAFTRAQVVTMAMTHTLIPAGVTRHIIAGGRALRVNLPLDQLAGKTSMEQANLDLHLYLEMLSPRIYREPTILFDS